MRSAAKTASAQRVHVAVCATKLMRTLAVVVASPDTLDTLLPVVEALGIRHVGHGARDEHYATVAEALLGTLAQGLGDARRCGGTRWTPASGLPRAGLPLTAAPDGVRSRVARYR